MEKPTISAREAEILTMISQGKNSIEIADLLCISQHTVNTHRKNILRKLRVNNSLHAITMFLQNQVIVQQSDRDHLAMAS